MNTDILWNCEEPIEDATNIIPPSFIGEGMTPNDMIAIYEGGCASGAWMDAVTYHKALEIMSDYKCDAIEYIIDSLGELPTPPKDCETWAHMAVFYLSYAVELWVSANIEEVADQLETD